MGAIRDVITSFDASTDLLQEAKAHLETLDDLASAKADLMQEQTQIALLSAGVGTDRTPAVATFGPEFKQTHAIRSETAQTIPDVIMAAVRDFVGGGSDNVVNGIAQIFTTAVQAVLGGENAEGSTTDRLVIALDGDGQSLVRVDFHVWAQSVRSSALQTQVEHVSAFYARKSVIDLAKLDFSTFNEYFEPVVKADNPGLDHLQLLEETKKYFHEFTSSPTT
ncbi:hypothetical protein [Umezawaea sp. Da 62-37]|uniref:hypothetical protein n=1 Tax=Umezawaea sp. Da 62-37 TaxID=3075927 RepID=UPI0028F71ABB|nr:hypothetical protein [Umezawaea sp. Da 62-37]WNV85114.1 hypothetical protein RM788_44395 [Umezawaea sp. Da 62-37]